VIPETIIEEAIAEHPQLAKYKHILEKVSRSSAEYTKSMCEEIARYWRPNELQTWELADIYISRQIRDWKI
jgi:oligoendopeptidase F